MHSAPGRPVGPCQSCTTYSPKDLSSGILDRTFKNADFTASLLMMPCFTRLFTSDALDVPELRQAMAVLDSAEYIC